MSTIITKGTFDLVFDGIDYKDYPDFVDAYIVSGKQNGIILSQEEIEELNDNKPFVNYQLHIYLMENN